MPDRPDSGGDEAKLPDDEQNLYGDASEAMLEIFNPDFTERELRDDVMREAYTRDLEQLDKDREQAQRTANEHEAAIRDADWATPDMSQASVTLPDGTPLEHLSDDDYIPSDYVIPGTKASNTWKLVAGVSAALGGVVLVFLALQLPGNGNETPVVPVPPTQSAQEDVAPPEATQSNVDDEQDQQPELEIEVPVSQATEGAVADPTGDLEPAFADFDGIVATREIGGRTGQDVMDDADVTAMEVISSSDEATTLITFDFNGAAQELQGAEGTSLGGDVLLTLSDGRILNVIFKPDGSIKISDIPQGMSISSRWVTPAQYEILVTGLVLDPGNQVEAFILIEAYGGIMRDVVTLTTSTP